MELATFTDHDIIYYKKVIMRLLIITAFFQLIYVGILYFLGSAGQLIRTDLLYWPPLGVFTLEKMTFWQNFAFILGGFCIIQLITGISYAVFKDTMIFEKIIPIIALIQLIFIPIGTIGGIFTLKIIQDINQPDLGQLSKQTSMKKITQEIGLTIIWSGLYHEGFLTLLYLLTMYLSTMMLDLTYPLITMGILFQIRTWIYILGGIFGGQILLGILYILNNQSRFVRFLVLLYVIIEFLLFPIGTYAGILIVKELRINNSKM